MPSSRSHQHSGLQMNPPPQTRRSKHSTANTHSTPPPSTSSHSDSESDYENHDSYIHNEEQNEPYPYAPETPSLDDYHQTLDAQIIDYFDSYNLQPYQRNPYNHTSSPLSPHSSLPSSNPNTSILETPLSPSSSSSQSPSPSSQPHINSLSLHDTHLYSKLLRSRRYGHIATACYENELARAHLTSQIALLNIELREKGEEMKRLVNVELSETWGVRDEAMPSWMGEVRYWRTWEEGCVGYFEGWEGYWERFLGGGEGMRGAESRSGDREGNRIWKRWGRGIRGVWGGRERRGESGRGCGEMK